MKYIASLLLCFASVSLFSNHAEELIQNVREEGLVNQTDENSGKLSQLLSSQDVQRSVRKSQASIKVETSMIFITELNGYNLHVADYYDGTRVITVLNGDLIGYQEVSVNGIPMNTSTDIKWHKRYFVHYYSSGKISTYEHKQILEVY
jgi:hypothetical protein